MYNRNTNEQTPRQKPSTIQERLLHADWQDLADRSCPLPTGITPEDILKHFGRMMLMKHDDIYGTSFTVNPFTRNS